MSCCGHSHSVDTSSIGTGDVNLVEVGGVAFAQGQRAIGSSLSVVLATGHAAVSVSGTVSATQGTSPWVVSGTVTATPTGTQDVNISQVGGASFAQGQRAIGSSLSVVLATSHAAVTVTGTVAATQSGTWILGANSGVDIGDVTINNAAGASAVNIQDGGNSITVDGSISVSNFPASQAVTTDIAKAEDSGHTTGATGSFILGVRNSVPTAFNSTDMDYTPIATDAFGRVLIATNLNDVSVTGVVSLGSEKNEDSASITGELGVHILGVRNDAGAAKTDTDGDYGSISLDSAGRIGITDLGGSITVDGTVAVSNSFALEATQLDVRTALQIIDDWDESDRAKVNPIVGQAGVQGGSGGVTALTQRTTLATDVALPSGTNAIGKVIQEANASGEGLLVLRDPALTNTAVAVKASAGRLYGYHIFNPGTALAYVQIYNVAAASVVVGTTTPIITLAMPSNSSSNVGVDHLFSTPVTFATAIAVAATTTPTGGTAPGTAIVVNVFYK